MCDDFVQAATFGKSQNRGWGAPDPRSTKRTEKKIEGVVKLSENKKRKAELGREGAKPLIKSICENQIVATGSQSELRRGYRLASYAKTGAGPGGQ